MKAEEEARRKAEEEARLRAEEEARLKASLANPIRPRTGKQLRNRYVLLSKVCILQVGQQDFLKKTPNFI